MERQWNRAHLAKVTALCRSVWAELLELPIPGPPLHFICFESSGAARAAQVLVSIDAQILAAQ